MCRRPLCRGSVELNIETHEFSKTSRAVPLLAGGELDVHLGAHYPGIVNAALKGVDIKIVAAREQVNRNCVGSMELFGLKSSLAEGEASLAALRGKRIARRRIGVAEFVLDGYLAAAGLTSTDVTFVEIGTQEAAAALLSGQVSPWWKASTRCRS